MKKKKDQHSISRRYYIQKIVGPSCIYQHNLNKSHLKGQKNNLQTKTDQIQRSNGPEAAYSLRTVEHIICIIYTCIHRIFNVYELELSSNVKESFIRSTSPSSPAHAKPQHLHNRSPLLRYSIWGFKPQNGNPFTFCCAFYFSSSIRFYNPKMVTPLFFFFFFSLISRSLLSSPSYTDKAFLEMFTWLYLT